FSFSSGVYSLMVRVPYAIKMDKIVYNLSGGCGTGETLAVGLYSADYSTKYFEGTDNCNSVSSPKTISISETTVQPGTYKLLFGTTSGSGTMGGETLSSTVRAVLNATTEFWGTCA